MTEIIIPMENPEQPLPPKKPEEVSKTNKLAYYLARTAAEEVTVKLSQVVELIGEKDANEIAIFCTKKAEAKNGRPRPNSLIPASRRTLSDRLASFNRADLLELIKKHQGEEAILPPEERLPNAYPDEMKLRAARKAANDKTPTPGQTKEQK